MFENLDDSNILMYAIKCYDKVHCIQSEFEEDFKRVRYVNRLLCRYRQSTEIKERLLLNHLVSLQNVFGVEATTRILFTRVPKDDWSSLKTFLLFTSAMPDVVKGIDGEDIISSDIKLDWKLVELLRSI
jgi:hypothetical protein